VRAKLLTCYNAGNFPLARAEMRNEFTAIIERGDGDWYIAYRLEIPGANCQGKSKEEVLENLADAIGPYP
jgi:hypothetical protein